MGTLSSNGYGRITRTIDKRRINAPVHCLVWVETNESRWPDGLISRHSCRNRYCCSPYHITPGTPQENTYDAQFRDGTMEVAIDRLPKHLHDRLRKEEAVEWDGQIWERVRGRPT